MRDDFEVIGPPRTVTTGICSTVYDMIQAACDKAEVSINSRMRKVLLHASCYYWGLSKWPEGRKRLSIILDECEREEVKRAATACGLQPTVWIRLMATADRTPLFEQLKEARKHLL